MNNYYQINNSKISTTTTLNEGLNKKISDSRTFMMGLAMLMVLLFHEDYNLIKIVDDFFSFCGLWGVDIFLFVSGFGIFYSLSSKPSARSFYFRRLLRIMPAAIIAGIIAFMLTNAGKLALLGLHLWYIRTSLIYYALSPWIYRLLMKYKPTPVLLVGLCASAVLYLVSIPFTNDESFLVRTVISWTPARFPAFLLGMYIARVNWKLKIMHNIYAVVFSIIAICLAIYMRYELYIEGSKTLILRLWPIPLACFLPMFTELCSCIRKLLPSFIVKIVCIFGIFSLEIYLLHEDLFKISLLLHTNIYLASIIGFGGSLMLALALHYMVKYVQNLCVRILIK